MRGFKKRAEVEAVVQLLQSRLKLAATESVPLEHAAGRRLAQTIVSPVDVPAFDRSAMDGYAVVASSTFGASEYSPVSLRIVGSARPGSRPSTEVGPGETVEIATGAPLPHGTDGVVKVEETRPGKSSDDGSASVEITAPISPGKNVSAVAEDIAQGTEILPTGRNLRPQDIGVLASIGTQAVTVFARTSVRILVTGGEIVPIGADGTGAASYRTIDANSPMLSSLVDRDGGRIDAVRYVDDDEAAIRRELRDAAQAAELVIVTGGSSVGPEDYVPRLLDELGELAVHGVAMRPSSPTGLGFIGEVPVFLLPGNPVSALCAYDFFVGPSLGWRARQPWGWPYPQQTATLARNIASEIGRVDYLRARLSERGLEPLAISGASILSTTVRADGFVVIPRELEGYRAGTEVTLYLYDPARHYPIQVDS